MNDDFSFEIDPYGVDSLEYDDHDTEDSFPSEELVRDESVDRFDDAPGGTEEASDADNWEPQDDE